MKWFSAVVREAIQGSLLAWFEAHKRDLPWRRTSDPYRIWISEIMLQQTQVRTVIPYYERFLKRFPTLKSLANSPLESVLECWSGLGYYRRARHLHEAAKTILVKHGGKFPSSFDEAVALPGMGRYSAGAVLSIAYNLDLPVVDGNVMRVFCRLIRSSTDPRTTQGKKEMWALAEALLPAGRAGAFNEALMELGARICAPRDPDCPGCPLGEVCKARKKGDPDAYPVKISKEIFRDHYQVCSVIEREGKILLVRETDSQWYRQLWHLPFFETGSTRVQRKKLMQEIKERFGLDVEVGSRLFENRFGITNHRVQQVVIRCDVVGGRLQPKKGRNTRWLSPEKLLQQALPSSQKQIPVVLKDEKRKV